MSSVPQSGVFYSDFPTRYSITRFVVLYRSGVGLWDSISAVGRAFNETEGHV